MIAQTQTIPFVQNDFSETLVRALKKWFQHTRPRQEAIEINNHLLNDMGMTRWETHQKYERPIWIV